MFWVFILYTLFASVFTIAKLALAVSEPLFLVGARMSVAGLLMLGFFLFFKRDSLKFKMKDAPSFLALGFLNIYLTNALEFWGLQYLTSFKTCFIYSLSPFFSALLAFAFFQEKLGVKRALCLLFGFLGFTPLFLHQTADETLSGTLLSFSWAEVAVMGAALSSVVGWLLLKNLVFDKGYHPIFTNGVAMGFGGALSLAHSLFVERWDPLPLSNLRLFILYGGGLLIISNLLAYNLYGYLLRRFSATFLSFAGFLTPLLSALFGWLFLDETVHLPFWISFSLVFPALFLYYNVEKKGAPEIS